MRKKGVSSQVRKRLARVRCVSRREVGAAVQLDRRWERRLFRGEREVDPAILRGCEEDSVAQGGADAPHAKLGAENGPSSFPSIDYSMLVPSLSW